MPVAECSHYAETKKVFASKKTAFFAFIIPFQICTNN